MATKLYNILKGVGSLLLVFPAQQDRPHLSRAFFNDRPSIQDTMQKDWETLGRDMYRAIDKNRHVQR